MQKRNRSYTLNAVERIRYMTTDIISSAIEEVRPKWASVSLPHTNECTITNTFYDLVASRFCSDRTAQLSLHMGDEDFKEAQMDVSFY